MSENNQIIPSSDNFKEVKLSQSLDDNLNNIKNILSQTFDLQVNPVLISGHKCAILDFEGMISTSASAELIFHPLMGIKLADGFTAENLYNFVDNECLLSYDKVVTETYGDLIRLIMSGFCCLLIDGYTKGLSFGIQGYDKRGVSEPTTEANVRGAQDGFVEVIRSNFSLIRRRLKSPKLKIELFQLGDKSETDVGIAYMTDKVTPELVERIKKDIKSSKLDIILCGGYIQPFIEGNTTSIFSNVTTTQRPDVLCAKINEGRVGVFVDGTPFVMVVPSLLIESFQTLDDYSNRPFYGTYIRWIKYIAVFLAVLLPGLYVAIATFHPEMFTHTFLIDLSSALEITPFSLLAETLIIVILFEVIREAGIRLPKVVGGAVSIVGGLVIGDAAVSSGLISTPLLIIVGITATSAFVIPELAQQIAVLRILFIIAGGYLGIFGIAALIVATVFNITAMEDYGVPYSAPLSPFSLKAMRDVFIRIGFKQMQKSSVDIEHLRGSVSLKNIK